jgi:ketosteroid isomerase-like protein
MVHIATAAEVAELTRLPDAWDKAIVRKDTAAIAGTMAEDAGPCGRMRLT